MYHVHAHCGRRWVPLLPLKGDVVGKLSSEFEVRGVPILMRMSFLSIDSPKGCGRERKEVGPFVRQIVRRGEKKGETT